jgi:hypothetical protein
MKVIQEVETLRNMGAGEMIQVKAGQFDPLFLLPFGR